MAQKLDLTPRRALVTGGAGFLGSHVCDRLIEEGMLVVCLDNLQTGRRDNISHLLPLDSFEFIQRDVRTDFQPVPSTRSGTSLARPRRHNIRPIRSAR